MSIGRFIFFSSRVNIPLEMEGGYLTKTEAAEYMRISIAALERLMRQGLPHMKLAEGRRGRVLFRRADVDAWLETKIVKK